ncbi:hypothetical protein ACET3Z_031106 [Daucus carota]
MSEFSFARFAMTESVYLNKSLLRDFLSSVSVVNEGQVFGLKCVIQGRTLMITEHTLNNALHLPTENFEDVPDRAERINFFFAIHCQRENGDLPAKMYVKHLPREWNFFFNSIYHVFAPKTGGFHGITTFNQEIGIAIAQNTRINLGHLIMGAFQDSLRKNRNVLLYPRFFQIVLNQLLTPAERAVYPNIDNVICSFMTTRVISMLENHQNYTNNEDVVLPEAMQEFLNNQNLPPPHIQNVADPVVPEEEVPETQSEQVTEPSSQANVPEAQTSQVEEEEVIVEDAETSSENNAQSEGEDSLQDNSTDSEDEVDSPAQTTAVAPSNDVMVDVDELFSNTYNPLLQSGIPSDSDNLSFSAPDWIQNLLDSNQLSPPLTSANELEIPQVHNQGTTSQVLEAETSQPLSQPLIISEREGESALSAPQKEIVSETAALSPSQERRIEPETTADMSISSPPQPHDIPIHSEVAHTFEELMVANTLSSMSGTDTVVSDPIQGQVPSQASGGNLDELPNSPSLSTPLGGTFPDPIRDSSPLDTVQCLTSVLVACEPDQCTKRQHVRSFAKYLSIEELIQSYQVICSKAKSSQMPAMPKLTAQMPYVKASTESHIRK